MDDIVENVSSQAITAFVLFIVLVWLSIGVGVVLAGLIGPRLPHVVTRIMDPTGTAAQRAQPPA